MSTDVLRRHLARFIAQLRSVVDQRLPAITCAMSWPEGDVPEGGYTSRYSRLIAGNSDLSVIVTDALHHPAVGCPHTISATVSYGGFGGVHASAFFPETVSREWHSPGPNPARSHPDPAELERAYQAVRETCRRLDSLAGGLPDRIARRLGLDRTVGSLNWVETLFHLGWHYPDHGIGAGRFRILSGAAQKYPDFACSELDLQLGGVRVTPDVFPGVLLSRLGANADFLSASLNALLLIEEAVNGIERGAAPQPTPEFRQLHETFQRIGEHLSTHPEELSARVLHFSDSFRTPPASEWAGVTRGGDGWGVPRTFVLSRRASERVVCVLRGPALENFLELADRAGSLLPAWPALAYPSVLADPAAFARYCDRDRFPQAAYLGDLWNRDMVTDHRGNVERWLGVAFALLMREGLSHFEMMSRPDNLTRAPVCGAVAAMLTLRGLNPFTASARALELSPLIPSADVPASVVRSVDPESATGRETTRSTPAVHPTLHRPEDAPNVEALSPPTRPEHSIASPPVPAGGAGIDLPQALPRIRCHDEDRSVFLDGARAVAEVKLPVYRFFKAVADAYPDAVTYPTISGRVPGLKGKHSTRDLKNRLPSPLDIWVQSGKHGYYLTLPPQK